MFWTFELIKNYQEFIELQRAVEEKKTTLIYGLTGSQKTFFQSALMGRFSKPMLIVTYNIQRVNEIQEDLLSMLPDAYKGKMVEFPKREEVFFDIVAKSGDIAQKRLTALKNAITGNSIIVTTADCLSKPLVSKEKFLSKRLILKVGLELEFKKISSNLVKMGYERVDIVEGKGQFSIRGGILDIYDPTELNPFRIEFFGDEIDSIRFFDIMSQRSTEKISQVTVYPAREILLDEDDWEKGAENIYKALENNKKNKKIYNKMAAIQERFRQKSYFEGLEQFYHYIFAKEYTIIDYFGEPPIVIIDEPVRCKEKIEGAQIELEENYKNSLLKGDGYILPEQFFSGWEWAKTLLKGLNPIMMSTLPKIPHGFKIDRVISCALKTMHPFYGRTDLFIQELKMWLKKEFRIVIISGTTERAKGIKESLKREGLIEGDNDLNIDEKGGITIIPGSIIGGFEYPSCKVAVISDKEIFIKPKKPLNVNKTKTRQRLLSFEDLRTGDFVVHENHGIGKYLGVERLELGGALRDYIALKYQGSDKLYIPIEQIGLIQKYVGTDENPPKLNKLGGTEWERIKRKTAKSIKEMAIDLLRLYAQRQSIKGHKFSKDTPWQREFEELFPYEETQDQLRAITEVKEDMEKETPMDRLLCGDVGYGKTEVAMRAAFKAVMDGKQVAMLVPTTILAQQHYSTFTERFGKFPVKIDHLSRFKTAKQQKETIEKLLSGQIDIIIGTHRLFQKDVKYKDLGLLIIDEEQRFGVVHKEKLKELKKNVDVLTLTATPIPRTLHMALVGIRDMSILENPPEDRFPVQTYVVEYNDGLVKEAIQKELARGGQVYFVYNRVQTIDSMAHRLRSLVPEARIAIAHGQMKEDELEQTMISFFHGEYDVLLCTTIIETGMDIPNVNTLIVYDSDRMGLSQLYQLRGRVGRSNRLGYSYFTYKKDKVLTEVAEKRLHAIKEFTEFGSGFKIAMRDLEIRGAGNILGAEQHGNMMAIGYDLYCKLLEQTISEMKGEELEKIWETVVDFKIDGYLPEDYIPMEEQRIEIYKKIVSAETIENLYDVEEEIEDRFGTLPDVVNNLITIASIKILARKVKLISVTQKDYTVTLKFAEGTLLPGGLLPKLSNDYNRKDHLVVVSIEKSPIFRLNTTKPLEDTLALLKRLNKYWGGETTNEK